VVILLMAILLVDILLVDIGWLLMVIILVHIVDYSINGY